MQATTHDPATRADDAIALFRLASTAHGEAVDTLTELQKQRPQQKTAALVRLCAIEHPVNKPKCYTVTQAEDVLQLDPEYAAYKAKIAVAEAEAREAEDDKRACFLAALARVNEVGGQVLMVPMGVSDDRD